MGSEKNRWGLAHAFRDEREELCSMDGVFRFWVGKSSPDIGTDFAGFERGMIPLDAVFRGGFGNEWIYGNGL